MTLPFGLESSRLVKLIRLLALLAVGYVQVRWQWERLDAQEREQAVQHWARRALRVFGVDLEVQGPLSSLGPVLMVSNHLSWLDILVYLGLGPVRFVSKSEVAAWPLVGRYAQACRTLFIERRSRRDVSRMVSLLAQSLAGGDVVMIFPEGTTSLGDAVLPFHANLLQAALQSGAPVQALALSYRLKATQSLTTTPCFIGDQTLVASIWAILGLGPTVAQISCAPQVAPESLGRERRALAHALHDEVARLHSALISRA